MTGKREDQKDVYESPTKPERPMRLMTTFDRIASVIRHLRDGMVLDLFRTRAKSGSRISERSIRLGPNRVHAFVNHPDGSLTDLGVSQNLLTNIGRDVFASWNGGFIPTAQNAPATANLHLDELVALTFTLASGSPSTAGPAVNIYSCGSADNTLWPIVQLSSGAPFTSGAGDGSVGALGTGLNPRLLGTFPIQTTTTNGERTFRTQPFSVAAAFGGVLPPAYSVMVENSTGVAFSSSTTTTANYDDLVRFE